MNPVYIYRFVRLFIVVAITTVCALTFVYTAKYTYPFIIGFAIAFMINPIVNILQNKTKIPRSIAVIITLIAIVSLFAGIITLLIAEIVSGANYLSNNIPKQLNLLVSFGEDFFEQTILPLYEKVTSMFNDLGSGQQQSIIENIQNAGKTIAKTVGDFIQDFFQKIPVFISWFPNAASVLIFSTLATFFISNDWYRFQGYVQRLVPKKIKESTGTVFSDLKKALFGFIKAQFTLISFTTLIVLIGLLILRVDYAITIAFVTGIVDIIPYLGTGTVFVPWIIYEIIVGNISLAIGLGILYIIVIIQRQVMEPKVLSSSIGLDPLATLVALFAGFKLIGFFGLIAGPVVLVIINTLHRSNVFKDIWMFIKGKENFN
ncbi:sporulation integral membrane protein YtvI [Bacillus massiliigorillae]|uniref:sporulation integral membrane protein YtvI n=1 Tax=Bacillus massiliigorillae TaxID=1243664 RepID=UPI0003A373DB|nr:sporulation integral membrane protein YtvI [Bacillus massiliigorillae]